LLLALLALLVAAAEGAGAAAAADDEHDPKLAFPLRCAGSLCSALRRSGSIGRRWALPCHRGAEACRRVEAA
jgi:hypothetical protein